jgi:adenine-specific DNA-methyltransferase
MPKRQWLWGKERVETALAKDELAFSQDKDGNWTIHTKQYLRDENGTIRQSKAFSIIDDVYTQHGTNEIIELFGDAQVFSFPKPTGLMKPLLDLATNKDSIILDFFAGSGTTADAVIQMNKKDNGNRKYLLVQLPEPCAQESIAFKAGFKTIADIGKERIRRVIHKLNAADAGKMVLDGVNKQDRGFRVFKLAESNFKTWDAQGAHDAAELEKQLEMHITHIRADRSPDDILSEIILKSGFSLTVPVVKLDLAGKIVFNIDDGALFICLEHELTLPLIRAMAEKKPARVVCLDAGFAGNDQLKTNAVLIFKNKGVTSFKTI